MVKDLFDFSAEPEKRSGDACEEVFQFLEHYKAEFANKDKVLKRLGIDKTFQVSLQNIGEGYNSRYYAMLIGEDKVLVNPHLSKGEIMLAHNAKKGPHYSFDDAHDKIREVFLSQFTNEELSTVKKYYRQIEFQEKMDNEHRLN